MKFFVLITLISVNFIISLPFESNKPQKIPECPSNSRVMYRPDGEPRKCLPHQNSLCLNAIDDKTDASRVCCWHNNVDYFCCLDVSPGQCPLYSNVTVVIHNNFQQNLLPVKSFHFSKGIEDKIDLGN